jgi:cation diffusion facilitator family transporter
MMTALWQGPVFFAAKARILEMSLESPTHTHHADHSHSHGVVDPSLFTSQRGIWAVKWSLVALLVTASLQIVIVAFSGSVGLLADGIHNFADALTAIPLWIAFKLAPRKPTRRFTYGYGRVEDLGGLVVVGMILLSAASTVVLSIHRLLHPQAVQHLGAVAAASLIGFIGNEGVAIFRIKVGKEIGSAALVADGYHARTDGWTSLAVLLGVLGVWLGYPIADPLIGLFITVLIVGILWDSGKTVFTRLLDGIDPHVIDELKEAILPVAGVREVTEVRVRWLGHRLHAEINIAVDDERSIKEAHEIGEHVRHELMHHVKYLSQVTLHVDPLSASGEHHHRTHS